MRLVRYEYCSDYEYVIYIWVTSESCTGRNNDEDEAPGRVRIIVSPVQDDEVTHIYYEYCITGK